MLLAAFHATILLPFRLLLSLAFPADQGASDGGHCPRRNADATRGGRPASWPPPTKATMQKFGSFCPPVPAASSLAAFARFSLFPTEAGAVSCLCAACHSIYRSRFRHTFKHVLHWRSENDLGGDTWWPGNKFSAQELPMMVSDLP